MPANLASLKVVFAALKPLLQKRVDDLAVGTDTPKVYKLVARRPSPFPQHRGRPLEFGTVALRRKYVVFELMPLYMNPALVRGLSVGLKKRLHRTCFRFQRMPDPEVIAELDRLAVGALKEWLANRWL
jgi:hypothetical protein